MPDKPSGRVLLLTVGTGDLAQPEKTLLAPLKKSIGRGRWSRVVLLPSKTTHGLADRLAHELDLQVEISPLPLNRMEDDADECYAHFDSVIGDLLSEGFKPEDILIDFTRGTKAMSAALVLAAVRYGLPQIRYITGKRDERGQVIPGSEIVSDFNTTAVTGRRILDAARRFFLWGDFTAALDILPDPASPSAALWPGDILTIALAVRQMALFYGSWDRLDYCAAGRVECPAMSSRTPQWEPLVPTRKMRGWVGDLAEPLPAGNCTAMAGRLKMLMIDLFANGERRMRDGQYEDAFVRAFRVVELAGQIRLCEKGLDSAALAPGDERVRRFLDSSGQGRLWELRRNRDGTFLANRGQAAWLLRALGDPMGSRLLKYKLTRLGKRNESILIHGFTAVTCPNPTAMRGLYRQIEPLLQDVVGREMRDKLAVARSMDFSRS